jgi:thioester reductase-like protein
MSVLALTHRRPAGAGALSVPGSLTETRLGLSASTYAELVNRVDAVVHSAAVTSFNRDDGSLEATNVGGTRQILEFAAAADVPLYHVSTAYLHARADGERGRTAVRYAASKREAEALVRASGVEHVILRPSIVIGDSRTGEITAFQGLYQVARALFDGLLPLIPFDPTWPVDFVPLDVVADAISAVVSTQVTSGEFWISAGERALTLREALETGIQLAAEFDRSVDAPRFVPPELFDRLIVPVFLDALPEELRATVLGLLEFFAAYLAVEEPLPSSLDELVPLGVQPLPDQAASLRASITYWAHERGYFPRVAAAV